MVADNNFSFPHPSHGLPDSSLTMLPSEFEPGDNDVICQRGKDSFEHTGNKHFRELIGGHINSYVEAGSRQEKSAIVAKIYDHIRMNASEPSTGFVRKDLFTRRWFLVSEKEARDKVGQALRDAIKIIRSSSRKSTPDRLVSENQKEPFVFDIPASLQIKRRKRTMKQDDEKPRTQGPSETKTEELFARENMWAMRIGRGDRNGSHFMSSKFFENQAHALGPFPMSNGLMGPGKLDDLDGLMSTMIESSIQPIDAGDGQKRKFNCSDTPANPYLFATDRLNQMYADTANVPFKKSTGLLRQDSPMPAANMPTKEENLLEFGFRTSSTLGRVGATGGGASFLPTLGYQTTTMYLAPLQSRPLQGGTVTWDLEPTPLSGNDPATSMALNSTTEQRAAALANLLWSEEANKYNC